MIEGHITEAALLELCAEECNELAHACLKLARKIRDENPTPVSEIYAKMDVIEEIADVELCIDVLMSKFNIPKSEIIFRKAQKKSRWESRIQTQNNIKGE